jgi:hypothetical protein
MVRLILSFTKSGRIDILSIHNRTKTGLTILACIEGLERLEIERKISEAKDIIKHSDLGSLASKHIIDDFRIFPAENREVVMQITKWA